MDISAEVAAIQAASQGSELRQPLVGALNKLNSGALPAVTASDVGKILKVGASGWEVGEKSGYMPVPTAAIQITENGTYDVTNYASAVVNVSGGSSAVLVQKTITQNGTYNPATDNADGYSEVIVNVSGSSSGVELLMNHGQVSNTSDYMTAYFQEPIDFSKYDYMIFIMHEGVLSNYSGKTSSAGAFYIDRPSYSTTARYTMNLTANSISCTHYGGSYLDLYIDVYGIKL